MGIQVDYDRARLRLRAAVSWADSDREVPAVWEERSIVIGEATSKTFTPMLGTALLARATDSRLDAVAIKESSGNNAYSARGLCHQVLVPAAVEWKFDLRATGREPLNNQPFFRYDRVDEVARTRNPQSLAYLVECLNEANRLDEDEALGALAAFIRVCLSRSESTPPSDLASVTFEIRSILLASKVLLQQAEGGKRAQALTAAVFDVVYSPDQVKSFLVNNPSRTFPGDVQVIGAGQRPVMSAEVRAKTVSQEEVEQFAQALSDQKIPRGLMVAISPRQEQFDMRPLTESLALRFGILMNLVYTVDDLLLSAFTWSTKPLPEILREFPQRVTDRLRGVNAEPTTISRWSELLR